MASMYLYPFQPIQGTTAPAFSSSALETGAALYALESTGVREWRYPTSRAIRLTEFSGGDYFVVTGTSDVVAAVGTGMGVLGGVSEVFRVEAGITHISIVSSTTVVVNVCLGTGA